MNCFQKLLSSWHDTTNWKKRSRCLSLWIAFKNYYLRDTTQPFTGNLSWIYRCELLSKIIIFVTRHNITFMDNIKVLVVNCFQKLLSSWHDTAYWHNNNTINQLWIAFKNYYLRDTTQLTIINHNTIISCELLSKIIIFVTRHSLIALNQHTLLVVNCFQKLLSSWHDTTSIIIVSIIIVLWIAFKNYYLRDTTQLTSLKSRNLWSCELLSKIIIFVTRHNLTTIIP